MQKVGRRALHMGRAPSLWRVAALCRVREPLSGSSTRNRIRQQSQGPAVIAVPRNRDYDLVDGKAGEHLLYDTWPQVAIHLAPVVAVSAPTMMAR